MMIHKAAFVYIFVYIYAKAATATSTMTSAQRTTTSTVTVTMQTQPQYQPIATTTTLVPCTLPTDANGRYIVSDGAFYFRVWQLQCNTGFMAQKTAGSLAICDGAGSLVAPIPQPCVTATNCSMEQITAVIDELPKTLPNNCLAEGMPDGDICGWRCPSSHDNVGGWRCQYGEIVGKPACLPRDGDVQATAVTVVAMEMEATITTISARGSVTGQGNWASVTSDALSQVLGTQIAFVTVTDAGGTMISNSSGRRLSMIEDDLHAGRMLQTEYWTDAARRFCNRIFFEAVILSTITIRADTVVQKGNLLTQAGSAEQTSYLMQMGNSGITVGNIVLLMAPRTFQIKVPVNSLGVVTSIWDLPVPDPDPVVVGGGITAESTADLGPIIGIVFGGIVGMGCCASLCYCCWLFRKRFRES